MDQIWGDFGKGGEDEAALVHGGMGEGQFGGRKDFACGIGVGVEE
jgi:hypothetical protein